MSDGTGEETTAVDRGVEELCHRLGHSFAHQALLRQALTHASIGGHGGSGGDIRTRSNERLEFLGDRVLGLIVARLLYDEYPREAEGALAQRHAALVCRETLAHVAETIRLGPLIRLSRGEEEAGGSRNPGLLADTCEAVIAALYLDGGMDAASGFVHRYWRPLMDAALRPPKDAKTALQEWAQGRGLALPRYREVAREGPAHAPRFTVEVSVDGGPRAATALGSSKRAAEQAAAEDLLEAIRLRGGD